MEVIQVYPQKDFTVYVYFSDGRIFLFDMKKYLGKGVFQKITDTDVFFEKCTVINKTLAWDIGGNYDPFSCIDISPETIYTTGIEVEDPLTGSA